MKPTHVNADTTKWRNSFYGLPAAYKAAPSIECAVERYIDCRATKIDAAAFWKSVDRSRK